MKQLCLSAGCLLLLWLVSPVFASSSSLFGKTVTRIDIRDDQGNPWPRPEQVLSLITFKPGDPFSAPAVRDTISLLYLKGLFKDVRVDAFPDGEGVRVEYTLFPITVVEKIAIHGNDAISKSTIRDAAAGIEGKELLDKKLSAIKTDILAHYQAEGF